MRALQEQCAQLLHAHLLHTLMQVLQCDMWLEEPVARLLYVLVAGCRSKRQAANVNRLSIGCILHAATNAAHALHSKSTCKEKHSDDMRPTRWGRCTTSVQAA